MITGGDLRQSRLDVGYKTFTISPCQGNAVSLAIKQSIAQRQNILRAAFAGQLVPQDPNDEPASVLLERIRAQRAAQAPVKKARGRRGKEAT